MSENYYQILGIARDSDEREIKRAYHRLARELHPDKAETPEKAHEMEQKFALVSTAYNLLKDSEQRKEYDRKTYGASAAPSSPPPPRPSTPTSTVMSASRPPSPSPAASPSPSPSSAPKVDINAQRSAIAQKAYVKGLQLMKEKDYAKAAEFFEAAIQNNENEAAYHAKLATSLIEAKKSANRAVEAAKRAIELDKYNLDYKFSLAQIYQTIGSKSNAIRIYEDILRWDKDNRMATQMIRELNKKENIFTRLIPGEILNKFRKK